MNAECKLASVTAVDKWGYLYCRHYGAEEAVKENIANLYKIIWKQCEEILQNKIQAEK